MRGSKLRSCSKRGHTSLRMRAEAETTARSIDVAQYFVEIALGSETRARNRGNMLELTGEWRKI